MSGSTERKWERRWAEGRELVKRITDEEFAKGFGFGKGFGSTGMSITRYIELARELMNAVGGPPAQPARQRQLFAGLRYEQEHREEIIQKHHGEWIATNQQGVVASNVEIVELRKELEPVFSKNPRFAVFFKYYGDPSKLL